MHITEYKKFAGKTPDQLSVEDLRRLVTYFELLGHVKTPVASLVIPVFKASESLMAHIFSLANLKTIIPYEVIFVNNNADKETLDILNKLGANVVVEEQQGITHARQKGLDVAKGKVICTMDPDSIYDPYYIDKMVLPFFEDPELVMCYSISKSYGQDFQLTKRMKIRNWLKVKYFGWKLSQGFMNRIKYVRAVAMAIRRETIAPLGYNTDLKVVSGCDDGILAIYLNNLGKFKYVPIDVYTALPPPREPGKPFPFCNERFLRTDKGIERTIAELEVEKAPE